MLYISREKEGAWAIKLLKAQKIALVNWKKALVYTQTNEKLNTFITVTKCTFTTQNLIELQKEKRKDFFVVAVLYMFIVC